MGIWEYRREPKKSRVTQFHPLFVAERELLGSSEEQGEDP